MGLEVEAERKASFKFHFDSINIRAYTLLLFS